MSPDAKGKGKRPSSEAPTEQLRPVDAAPEFRAEHHCRSMPLGMSVQNVQNVQNVPPAGWRIRVGGKLLGTRPGLMIGPVAFCAFCGAELEVQR